MRPSIRQEGDPRLAIRDCLEYLYTEAKQANLPLVAHLIGAAEECLTDLLNASKSEAIRHCENGNWRKRSGLPNNEDQDNGRSRS